MSYPKYLVCGAVALSMLGAGCSSSTTSSVTTGATPTGGSPTATNPSTLAPNLVVVAPSACELFTLADAQTILSGATLKQNPVKPVDPSSSLCSFSVATTKILNTQGVNLAVHAYASASLASDYMLHAKEALTLAHLTPQPVAGLGDEAVWAGPSINQLIVRVNSRVVLLTVISPDVAKLSESDQLQLSVKAMKKALSRLP